MFSEFGIPRAPEIEPKPADGSVDSKLNELWSEVFSNTDAMRSLHAFSVNRRTAESGKVVATRPLPNGRLWRMYEITSVDRKGQNVVRSHTKKIKDLIFSGEDADITPEEIEGLPIWRADEWMRDVKQV